MYKPLSQKFILREGEIAERERAKKERTEKLISEGKLRYVTKETQFGTIRFLVKA